MTRPSIPPLPNSPSSLFLYLLGYLCTGFTLVCPVDFKAVGDVSIFQPNGDARDTLGSTGTASQEEASEAFQKNPIFLGNTSAFTEFPKLRVLLSGKFHKNKTPRSPALQWAFSRLQGLSPLIPRKHRHECAWVWRAGQGADQRSAMSWESDGCF